MDATGGVVLDHDNVDIRRALRMVRDELVDMDQVAQEEKADVLGVFVEEPWSGPSPKTTLALALRCGAYTAIASPIFGSALIGLLASLQWRQIPGTPARANGAPKESAGRSGAVAV